MGGGGRGGGGMTRRWREVNLCAGGRPDSRGCCGSWERQEGCLGVLRCGALRAHLRKKIVTARSVRTGDRLLLTRQCGPENGYHGRARGDGGERDSDPSPTKTHNGKRANGEREVNLPSPACTSQPQAAQLRPPSSPASNQHRCPPFTQLLLASCVACSV